MLSLMVVDELYDMLTWWLFEDVHQFYEMYDELCRSPSTCSLATSALVYCALCWLLEGNPIMQRAGIDMSKYADYVPVCYKHLATCLSSYTLFVEPTDDNIAALSTAVSGFFSNLAAMLHLLTQCRPHLLSTLPTLARLGP